MLEDLCKKMEWFQQAKVKSVKTISNAWINFQNALESFRSLKANNAKMDIHRMVFFQILIRNY